MQHLEQGESLKSRIRVGFLDDTLRCWTEYERFVAVCAVESLSHFTEPTTSTIWYNTLPCYIEFCYDRVVGMIIKYIPARLDTSVGQILSTSLHMKEQYDAIFQT
jgi:hypothetical protein